MDWETPNNGRRCCLRSIPATERTESISISRLQTRRSLPRTNMSNSTCFVKNAGTLIVKVFEINTQTSTASNCERWIPTSISDGLVANVEQHVPARATVRRVSKSFRVSSTRKPGFMSSILLSATVQQPGTDSQRTAAEYLVGTSTVGQLFTILDENSQQVKDATLWMAGHEYTPGEDGTIPSPSAATADVSRSSFRAGIVVAGLLPARVGKLWIDAGFMSTANRY